MSKLKRLSDIIKRYKRVAIAYSGGVDSTFLLFFTKKFANVEALAFTAISDTYTEEELRFATSFAKSLGVKHILIKTNEFNNERFVSNPEDRCFYCKSEIFSKIDELREKYGFEVIFDGTNYSDLKDFRPGRLARMKYNVLSPLEMAGIKKEDIRRYSKRFNIKGYDRPPNACLASRIPYGTRLEKDLLEKVASIERSLRALGISNVRLRHHDNIARIETSIVDIKKVLLHRDRIVKEIKGHGYKYVTLDLEGYRTGSMNI